MNVRRTVLGRGGATVIALQSCPPLSTEQAVKLSVVIPARNEAGNIGPTVDGICERLRREAVDYEIVVVDDGSTDATPAEIRARAQADGGVRLVVNDGPHGFGLAVRCGLDTFTGDAVAIMMADGSDSPDDLVKYYYVLRDRAECAFGSRFVPGGQVVDYPRGKLLVNRLANWFVRMLFGLRFNDVTNAFKGYRREVIQGCRPFLSPHFNLTVEIPLKAIVRGYSYETVPITWRQRKIGVSSLHLQEMGSRYLFIVLHVLFEKMLTRGDYRRRDGATPAAVRRPDDGATRMVARPDTF
jgi:dolichol-phosphate mannosyltransferase